MDTIPLMFTSYVPDKLSFTFYKNEEIEKMSVMEVLQPQSLDNFNHPIPDGLCDPRMGPHSPDGICKTCHLTYLNCPGHFGHIRLEKPVFNPILFSTLYSLLRSTCFKCKFLKITNYDRVILYLKFNLLKKGCSIDNLEFLYSIPTESELYTRIIEILMSSEGINVTSSYKHQELASLVFKSASMKTRCLKCRYKNSKIIHSKNLKILIDNNDESSNKKHNFFNPEDVAEIFKDLFKNESDLMEAIFSTNDYQMFFMLNIAVPPVKFRPVNFYKGKSYENPQNLNFIHIIKMNNEVKKDIEYWPELQAAILFYFDSSKSSYVKAEVSAGHKQILEKKDGLFRRNIMGKRVNFSARSVISPDPNLGTREMGIPKIFAEKLTFPEKVNSTNYDNLRKAVINGSKYPGATAIQFGKHLQNLEYISYEKRVALANQLLSGNKSVWRHLHTGDVVLVNRQPTLHKSSIMAHKVRVLEGEKTLRMHYANCKSYNADFDGDEMNIHFPQSQVARAEAEYISLNDNMYLIPTNGEPVRGLTQDHVVAASVLTLKDSFFTKENFIDLLSSGLPCRKLILEKPCINKPVELYSGKQVISVILKNLNIYINLKKKTKIIEQSWRDHAEEAECIFQDGEMLTGILDKNTIGPTHASLIHACGEIYGFSVTNDLLTYISRIVNRYLFIFGFTLRIDDLLLDKNSDMMRDKLIKEGSRIASSKQKDFVEKDKTFYLNQNKVGFLDSIIREEMNNVTTKIVDACVPSGLMKKFPYNNMGFIIITGAKGSMVNLSQISASLGQQDLEGKRVSIMVSGKTLPCYKPFESCPSAGGYVFQRFLTGVNPPEFFFHCMAGREGLIDTAVKTSRSGYLQRCLVKHLEGIKVEYDLSVRMEGVLIQYLYGEDGLDCTRSMFLNEFEFYKNNIHILKDLSKNIIMSEDKMCSKVQNLSFRKNLSSFDPSYKEILYKNYIKALIDPGEAVGILAGQSVGEPSTQMTLNTFHLAGVGAKNVTLGIPRLREIIMVASKKIKTPLITVPLKKMPSAEFIEEFKKVTLKECVENISLEENLVSKQGIFQKEIKITISISQNEKYAVPYLDTKFLTDLGKNIKKLSKISGFINILEITTNSKCERTEDEDSDKDKESSHEDNDGIVLNGEESKEEEELKKDEEDDLTAVALDQEETNANTEDVSGDEESIEIKLNNFKKIGHKKYCFVAYYPSDFNIMMLPVIESLLSKIVIKEHRGVNRATISNNNVLIEGSDFHSLTDLVHVGEDEVDPLDFFNVYESTSNDIYGICTTFGIEAARESIINEIINVFDAYGIEIDIRHLKLIADYMTRNGEFSAFNRNGLNYSNSPLQKMSFESCFINIKKASEYHLTDNLDNPSASLTVGVPINVGTTVFDLLYDMNSHMV